MGRPEGMTKILVDKKSRRVLGMGMVGVNAGELIAERASGAGIETAVFDRGGNQYHGRVAALAEGARENGLKV